MGIIFESLRQFWYFTGFANATWQNLVMILIGILAAVAVPRMSDTSMFNQSGFHDEVVAALRYAQKSAVSRGSPGGLTHRRRRCENASAHRKAQKARNTSRVDFHVNLTTLD